LRRWLAGRPPIGLVRFGSLRRTSPIAAYHGAYRGQPIDRYYIERFLRRHAEDIHGRVLEIGDRSYTERFGRERVTQSDVLHMDATNPLATIVADLTTADAVPSDSFDCIICVQTVQFIFDISAALRQLHRILKPGGVLLLTTHGISQLDSSAIDRWGEYWRLTSRATSRLLATAFGEEQVEVEAHGNVLAAIALLHGVTVGELRQSELDHHDPIYELLITARAVKAPAAEA
jgi:SAM-dependent methyltransferase